MLDKLASTLADQAGIVTVDDLGCVWRGKDGPNTVEAEVTRETWRGAWFFRIAVTHSRGRSFRKTRVVKWAYGLDGSAELSRIVADLAAVEGATPDTGLPDTRTGLGRAFDRLTGRRYCGTYTFGSTIQGEHETSVTAEIGTSGPLMIVSLTERRPGSGFILAHLPQAAFGALRAAAESLR